MSRAARVTLVILAVGMMVAGAGCGSKKKSQQAIAMTAQERYEQGLEAIEQDKLRQATTLLSRIDYYSGENRQQLEPLVRLALADATFYQGNDLALIDARSLYLDFVTLYGDHEQAPYAQFQAGVCSLSQVRHPSRDQTQTLQAIEDLRAVESRYPGSRYAGAARAMREKAESNLVQHELLVAKFYMKREAYLAAADRFREILEKYPNYHDKEEVYFLLSQALIRSNNPGEARVYLDKLVTDFPDGRYTDQARKALDEAGGTLDLDLGNSP